MTNIITVKVLSVEPNRLLVQCLDRSEQGVIYRREWTWDRRVTVLPFVPAVGGEYQAKLLGKKNRDGLQVLSLRQIEPDPWEDAKGKFRKGDVVSAEIVNVRHFGAFAQIKPGVTGIIYPRDVPMLPSESIDHILSLGDQILGTISAIDFENRKLEINITRRLDQFSLLHQLRHVYQYDLLSKDLDTDFSRQRRIQVQRASGTWSDVQQAGLVNLQRLLVVDNDATEYENIYQPLEQHLAVEVDFVLSAEVALSHFHTDRNYDLVIIDYDLGDLTGITVAEQLLRIEADMPIIITSSLLPEETIQVIKAIGAVCEVKMTEKLVAAIQTIARQQIGLLPAPERIEKAASPLFMRDLDMVAYGQFATSANLQMLVEQLLVALGATQILVVELNRRNQETQIIAAAPLLPSVLKKQLESGTQLYHSPLRDIIEDGLELHLSNINRQEVRGIHNLFPLLAYRSCLGVPLAIPGLVTQHALLVFKDQLGEFSEQTQATINNTRLRLQVTLERIELFTYMRRFERRYTLGQLLNSMDHELRNRLSGLNTDILTLEDTLNRLRTADATDQSQWLSTALSQVESLKEAKQQFGKIINAYTRLDSHKFAAVDLNQLVDKVNAQFTKQGQAAGTTIELHCESTLPDAYVDQSSLEQVLTNVILNAIQQIEQQRKRMSLIAQKCSWPMPLLQKGLVTIETRYVAEDEECPLKIIVTDNGPGIHYHRQDEIFLLDTSDREEGQGLGLYISRGLMESMGGRIRLVKSIMFVGTAFVIELPANTAPGVAQ